MYIKITASKAEVVRGQTSAAVAFAWILDLSI